MTAKEYLESKGLNDHDYMDSGMIDHISEMMEEYANKRPCMGLIEMCVHDHFTTHNSIEEITDEQSEAIVMQFLESNMDWLQINDYRGI